MSSDDKGGEYLASLLRPPFEHTRSCPALIKDACTCGLEWRIRVATEQQLHAAWRKRAEEAEARSSCPATDALRELVRLKRIKERIEQAGLPDGPARHDVVLLSKEYEGSKDKAWAAAKLALPEYTPTTNAAGSSINTVASQEAAAGAPGHSPAAPVNAAGQENKAGAVSSGADFKGSDLEGAGLTGADSLSRALPNTPAPAAPVSASAPSDDRIIASDLDSIKIEDMVATPAWVYRVIRRAVRHLEAQRSSSTTLTVPRSALDRAAYALFEIKRFVDAGPMTRRHAAEAHEEACKVLEEASVSSTTDMQVLQHLVWIAETAEADKSLSAQDLWALNKAREALSATTPRADG